MFKGWSEHIKLYQGISKLLSSSRVLDVKKVSEKQLISILYAKLYEVGAWTFEKFIGRNTI